MNASSFGRATLDLSKNFPPMIPVFLPGQSSTDYLVLFCRSERDRQRGTVVRRAVPDCSKIEMVSSDRKYVMTNLRILSTELSEFNLATNRSSCEFKPERSFAMNFMKSFCGGFGRSESQFARESSSEPNPLYGAISLAGTEIQNQFSYR